MREWRREVERRLRRAGLDAATERDVAEELAQHMQDRYEELRGRGVPEDAARRAVLAELEEDDELAERVRQVLPPRPEPLALGRPGATERLGGWWGDVRFAARRLARARAYTAVVLIVLALGIGVNTAVFTAVNTVLLRPPPGVTDPDELAVVYTSDYSGPRYGTSSYPDYQAIVEMGIFESVAAHTPADLAITEGGRINRVLGEVVSANYFDVLGVSPAAGRFFSDDEGAIGVTAAVVVISHGLWQSRFGGGREAIGSTLVLTGEPFTIIGVTPPEFGGSLRGVRAQLWAPLSAPRGPIGIEPTHRGNRSLQIVGRLGEGVTLEAVRSALDALSSNLHEAFPDQWTDVDDRARVFTVIPESEARVPRRARGAILGGMALVMGAVLAVLLVACTNIANLQLSRASARTAEMGIRIALGASRGRIVRHLLAESLLVAALGGGAGLLLTVVLTRRLTVIQLPEWMSVSLDTAVDLRVLAFAAGLTLLTGLVFGLAPALHASRSPAPMLTGFAPTGSTLRLRRALVIVQVACSLVLLVSGGLFMRSLGAARGSETGFDADGVALARFTLDLEGYTEERSVAFFGELLGRVSTLSGVSAATLAETVPLSAGYSRRSVRVEGYESEPGENMEFMYNGVTPGYFATMGLELRLGRDFTIGDAAQAPPVAIVSEAFARRFWPGENPIGKRIGFEGSEGPFREVVGVAADATYRSQLEDPQPYFYYPHAQYPSAYMVLLARTPGDVDVLADELRRHIREMDPSISTATVQTFRQHLASAMIPQRIAAVLLAVLGAFAIAIAVIGLYGIVAFGVVQRAREFGVRMALGAMASDVRRLVLGDALRTALLGILWGLPPAVAVAFVVSGFIMVRPIDPVAFLVVPLLLVAAAGLAAYAPASRATRQDPATALRSE